MSKFIQLVVGSKALPPVDCGVLLSRKVHAKVRVWGTKYGIRFYLLG